MKHLSELGLCIFVAVLDLLWGFFSEDISEIIVSSTIFSNFSLKFLDDLKVLHALGVYSLGRLLIELGFEQSFNTGDCEFMQFLF